MNRGVENTLYKERQRDLGFFILENRKLKGMLLLSSTNTMVQRKQRPGSTQRYTVVQGVRKGIQVGMRKTLTRY